MSLQSRWNNICSATIGTPDFWTVCVDHRAARQALHPLIEKYASGVALDAGAGRLAWREMISRKCERYVSVDYTKTHPELTAVGDLLKGLPFEPRTFDTIFCCSVLEHVEDPDAALKELARVLKPGGKLILSVPFRYYLHGAPIDYFRFTTHGVQLLAGRQGFDVVSLTSSGGLAHEMGQALSMLAAALFGPSKVGIAASQAVAGVLWRVAAIIDRLDSEGRFAQNVNAVLARRL